MKTSPTVLILISLSVLISGATCASPIVKDTDTLRNMTGYIDSMVYVNRSMGLRLRFPELTKFFADRLGKGDTELSGPYFHSNAAADEDMPYARHYFSTRVELPKPYQGTIYLFCQKPDIAVTESMVDVVIKNQLATFVGVVTRTDESKIKPHLNAEFKDVNGHKVERVVADVVGVKSGAFALAYYGLWSKQQFMIIRVVALVPPATAKGDEAGKIARARVAEIEKIIFKLEKF